MPFVYADLRIGDNVYNIRSCVRAATVVNGDLSTDFAAGQTIDGVTLIAGDIILIKNQSAAAENGIYWVEAVGTPTRAYGLEPGNSASAVFTWICEGDINATTGWICTNTPGLDEVGVGLLDFQRYDARGALDVSRGGTGVNLTGATAFRLLQTNAGSTAFETTTTPRVTALHDTNGNPTVTLVGDASPANHVRVSSGDTGIEPSISVIGTDTDIDLLLQTKGAGMLIVGSESAGNAGAIAFEDNDGAESVTITVPGSLSGSYALRLPNGVGSSGYVLTTDGANPAALTWSAPLPASLIATSTLGTSTASAVYVLIADMEFVTPTAGTWLVTFSSSGTVDAANTTTEYIISIDGGTSAVAGSTREIRITTNGNTGSISALHAMTHVTVTGAENIGVYYRTSAGTFSIGARSLSAIRVA
jgi:hypothetical protein